jgi:pimeloyl-ACP methyl ester carboxylesterase
MGGGTVNERSGWKHPARPPIDTPTVVRWGGLDPIEPPSWAEGIEQTFPNLDFRFVPTRDTSSLSKP